MFHHVADLPHPGFGPGDIAMRLRTERRVILRVWLWDLAVTPVSSISKMAAPFRGTLATNELAKNRCIADYSVRAPQGLVAIEDSPHFTVGDFLHRGFLRWNPQFHLKHKLTSDRSSMQKVPLCLIVLARDQIRGVGSKYHSVPREPRNGSV